MVREGGQGGAQKPVHLFILQKWGARAPVHPPLATGLGTEQYTRVVQHQLMITFHYLYRTFLWHLPDLYLTSTWPLPHIYLTPTWHSHDGYLTNTWPLSDFYQTSSWPIPDLYLTSTWPLPLLGGDRPLHEPEWGGAARDLATVPERLLWKLQVQVHVPQVPVQVPLQVPWEDDLWGMQEEMFRYRIAR